VNDDGNKDRAMATEELHPDAQRVCDLIVAVNRPAMETLSPAQAREAYLASRKALQPDPEDVADVPAVEAAGPARPNTQRLYRGNGTGSNPQPAIDYYHGCGGVICDLESHDQACRAFANAAGCIVIAVDYRLAPEHNFPAGLDDGIAASCWIWENAGRLGIDGGRIAIGGDSAGGNLAAVVALDARDRGGPPIALQVLIYPSTDMAMSFPSHERHAEQLPLRRTTMRWFVDHYLRNAADKDDWRASPLRAASFANVPPALVVTAGFDPLCDEGEAYAKALARAGVPVTLERFEGHLHGFLNMGRMVADSGRLVALVADALRRTLHD
jgi:acetyl esterase